jgi:alpha-1,3-rhamnosyl/mannosyltransferase
MSAARSTDVIVVVDRHAPAALACLERVLKFSGATLNRLIVIAEGAVAAETRRDLEALGDGDPRLAILSCTDPRGYVDSCNRGLRARECDAVILSPSAQVAAGWLSELAHVAHSEERVACAAPLSHLMQFHSGAEIDPGKLIEATDRARQSAAYSALPRATTIPTLEGSCIYLRTEMIDAVGLLDDAFASFDSAVDDWVMRAQSLGFFVKRANHACVNDASSLAAANQEKPVGQRQRAFLDSRHPQLRLRAEAFERTLDGRLAAHAAEFHRTGKIRIAYDLRHIPPENVGTRTYAVNLARALARLPEIELTLLVRLSVQAEELPGRVVTEDQWRDDVAVIHKPAQVFNRQELALLFGSSAHVILTYQDMIAYRIPEVFPSDREHEAYRSTSALSVQAAQGILAYSESSAREIACQFGLQRREITVAPLGVDARWFAHRDKAGAAIFRKLKLPPRYFFSLATDYPHKNLSGLLGAYALLRSRWTDGEPPALVLAGHSVGARARLYEGMESERLASGIIFLGPASPRELRVLYQRAVALVFPSLYEGFGLPPLEAMAAGTPVVALRASSVPEVAGDAALYAEGLSAAALARAMERVAASEQLRSDLRDRGLKRAVLFRWENTARATFDLYRMAVLEPGQRSLHARRMFREAILHWSDRSLADLPLTRDQANDPLTNPRSLGVRNAWRALHVAVRARMRRELKRFQPGIRRRTA